MNDNLADIVNKSKRTQFSHMRKLEELTEHLSFSQITRQNNGVTQIETEIGTILFLAIFKSKDVAVARVFGSSGSKAKFHIHEGGKEWFIVLSGKINVEFSDKRQDKTIEAGDEICIFSGNLHRACFIEDSWILAITVPADESYPDPI